MGELVPILFLAVILKIPVLYGMWLIYWAVKDEPQVEDLPGESDDHSFRRFRRTPIKPRGPRTRGPHGGGAAARPAPEGGRARTPAVRPRLAPGAATAHERRKHTPVGS